MGQLQAGAGQAVPVHSVAVVLGSDLDFVREQVFHRVVAAPVAELQLIGLGAIGQGENLVAQADAENGGICPGAGAPAR